MPAEAITDQQFYERAVGRIYHHIVWLAIAGTMVAAWQGGMGWAAGFLIGATASALNFRWLHHMVDSIGETKKKQSKALGCFLGSRYVLFGVTGYVIVRYFRVDIMAALVGLFVAVAAVMVEIVYELLYART